MATRLYWSWFVSGSACNSIADRIESFVGEDHTVFNRSDLMMQLGQVIYAVSRVHDVTVRMVAGTVTIEHKNFTLTLTEKWVMERAPRIEWNNIR